MKTLLTKLLAAVAFAALAASHSLYAEDIDVFGGAGGSATPDILIIVDNTSSNDAAYTSSCPFTGAPANLPNGNLLDMVYCALYGAVDAVKSSPQLLGKLSIALMSGGSGSNKGGQFYLPASSPYNPVLMDTAGIATFENAISAGIPKATGNAKLDGDMTEAWAWLTGNTGPRSGTSYSAHIGTLACQKSFIILIGATSKQGRPCNGSGCWASSELTTAGWTSAQQTYINTSNLGTSTGLDQTSYVDEWARYFNQTDFNNNANDRQNAVMYTITAGSDPHNIPASGTPDYTQELLSAADQGGGKAFSGIDYTSIKNGLLQIFNEVAAVNSVFASSSLPISSNTQGTYQNQIFIGMFRPDATDAPRWLGNLKQYQFGVGGTTANPTLFVADASGTAAINASTGFITPTAASFWTTKDTSKLPDNISATGGFWVNDQQGSGAGFDSPDGEVVEKGGVSQQIRLANLQDDYTTAAGTSTNPRNVYTCTTGCTTGSSLSATPFATSNTALTQAAFGITGPTSNVSSITRTGNVVTMTLSAAPTPALTSGQNVTVSGAVNAELNGNFTITLVNTTTFTYMITESPPTPSTGTYTASIPATPISISTLTRSLSGSTWIATATTASAHGFTTGQKVTILGAGQAEYNGQQTITVTGSKTFTYPITPGPSAAVGGGNATDGSGLNPTTITSLTLGTIGSTAPFSATVTAKISASSAPPYTVGANVIVSNVVPSGYDGTFTVTAVGTTGNGSNKRGTFSYAINTTPASPATGTLSVDPSASVALTNLTHTISCSGTTPSPNDTVTANTATTNPFSAGQTVTISGTPGSRESAYLASFLIGSATSTAFTLSAPITTSPPCTPSPTGVKVSTGASSVDLTGFINWVRGDDDQGDEPSPQNGITVRPSVHGDVVHARPTVVNYGSSTGVVVFYGSNDGTFRAVNGNQPGGNTIGSATPGQEIWSFVAPEFFYDSTKGYSPLVRLFQNAPDLQLASTPSGLVPTPKPKDYFFDGSAGVFQDTANARVYLYLSARRGGRFIYALDVTSPSAPKLLWKKSSTDFPELGYTWSTPKATRLRGYVDGSGKSIPVVIFGGGYDPNEDNQPPTADTMGRGIYILDGTDGHLVWSATNGSGATGSCTGTCTLSDMTYAIPADITLVNRDFDLTGYIDRLYAADLGGNIWRVDLEPAGYGAAASSIGPSTWKITKFAAVGGASSDATKRKFFFPPDVVATKTFDMVLAGTGDREHPLYSANTTQSYSIVNRFYGLKDANVGSSVASGTATITDSSSDTTNTTPVTGLTDASTTPYDQTTANNGFFITFPNAGEKAVNAPTTVGGFTYIGTSTPPAPTSLACNNLGTARGYQINFLTGANASVTFTTGGLPPSPVAGLVTVNIGGTDRLVPFCIGCGNPAGGGPDSTSSIGGGRPPIPVPPVRKRVYWYLEKHDN